MKRTLTILVAVMALMVLLVGPSMAATRTGGSLGNPHISPAPQYGKLAVRTYDVTANYDVILPGAAIMVYDEYGKLVDKGLSDKYGYYAVMLESGTYKVHITADGYKDAVEGIGIKANVINAMIVGMAK